MKEIKDIINAYTLAQQQGKKTALATVVRVEGSSYRQPGARMLVTEDGQLTGAISGGCLEGDALKKALLAIYQQQNKLVTYDTSNEDDAEFGVQLGCNGIVHILFEPIMATQPNNPIELLKVLASKREDAVLVSLFSLQRGAVQSGTFYLCQGSTEITIGDNFKAIIADAKEALSNKKSAIRQYNNEAGTLQALIAFIPPPLSLVIAGAGNDVMPLVKIAGVLGWDITVADGRATHATPQRFPDAHVMVARPHELIEKVTIDTQTFFVLMTHNYKYDLALLELLLTHSVPYIGILGPKTKLERMLSDLNEKGIILTEQQKEIIYGPVGLDIGAETSEEIAVSVIAEIKAVLEEKGGTPLKYKQDKIHTATIVA